jgi:hypothetical protein
VVRTGVQDVESRCSGGRNELVQVVQSAGLQSRQLVQVVQSMNSRYNKNPLGVGRVGEQSLLFRPL